MAKIVLFCLLSLLACAAGQRITTIHLDGVQYFISRMNPYSPELNYFLAYQYCRSLGLQLASFETKEKAESMTTYLKNAGYGNYDFWTSGNRLGTGMFLWMSTGLPFNATFDFFENSADAIQAGLLDPVDHNSNTSPQRTARDSSGAEKGCVILKQPTLKWMPEDCSAVKDFICEQTRCYYYNYGSIPVSSAQGRPITSTTPRTPASLMNLHVAATTTPLPLLMSTSGAMYTAAKAKSSPAVGHRLIDDSSSQQQPSFMSFKLNHDRSLPDTDSTDVDVEDQEADLDGEEHDDHEAEGEEEHDEHDNFEEHARELSNDNDGDIKEHVFPLSDNELHPEVHSIEEVQQQLQQEDADADSAPAPAAAEDNESSQHDAEADGEHEQDGAEGETDLENETPVDLIKANEPLAMPSSTESPAAAIEERIKQIAQDFQKMASSQELQPKEELTPQSSLSLNDLIRTLRPNEQQIIPQIDSDYSNAMRVLGKPMAANN
uniref:Narrow, isoform E n=1 Tax=Drosophila melanogaster TaxID=7227 RepID=A1ZAU3_DROME|nr:narrow, isoform E [Drosophila melanogaster]AAF57851.2 narrow, isoform E [Drosophila melanogaster]|eukprot:NP_001027436.2 narrow, isoform E [Drosophila melanogaster]